MFVKKKENVHYEYNEVCNICRITYCLYWFVFSNTFNYFKSDVFLFERKSFGVLFGGMVITKMRVSRMKENWLGGMAGYGRNFLLKMRLCAIKDEMILKMCSFPV